MPHLASKVIWAHAGACCAIALAGIAAYYNSFSGPLVFDDQRSISENPTIQHLLLIGKVLNPPPGGRTVSGRPALNLSLAINYALGGDRVWGYHASNVAIHILAGLILFGILRRTVERLNPGTAATSIAFAAALLWTVHPLQTESVTYIIQRAESLMGLFYFLTLYGFIVGADGEKAAGHKVFLWFGLSWLACLFGMATKEVMVSAPVIVFLYDRTFVAGSFREAWRCRRGYYLCLASTWLLLGYLVAGATDRGGHSGFGVGISPWSYWVTQAPAVVNYLRLSVWPHPLVFDYTFDIRSSQDPLTALPCALILILLIAGTGYSLFRPAKRLGMRALGFAGVWFFAILAPTSVVPGNLQTMAEHRMYLALAPVTALAAAGIYCVRRHQVAWAMTCVLGVVFGCMTFQRNKLYQSELALWSDTTAKAPDNFIARTNLGDALHDAGRLPEAIAEYERALQLKPDDAEAHYNLGIALADSNRLPEAVSQYRQALRLKPDDVMMHVNLGVALQGMGLLAEAMAQFDDALRTQPAAAFVHNDLANAMYAAKRLPEAVAQYKEALRLEPDFVDAYYNLAVALTDSGQYAEAIGAYEEALRMRPNFAEAHNNLANILGGLGRMEEAIGHYESALRLKMDDPSLHEHLGMALKAVGRASEAQAEFDAAARGRAAK